MRLPLGKTLLFLAIPFVVVLDVANGLLGEGVGIPALPITPGEFGRGVLLFIGVLVIVKLRGPHFRFLHLSIVTLLLLGILGPLCGLFATGDMVGFAFDFEVLSKVLYGPIIIAVFTALYLRFPEVRLGQVLATIGVWGGIAGLGVVVFKLARIGEATYGEYSSAYKGLFLAQNDVGLGMVIALAATTHLSIEAPRLRRVGMLLTTVAGMLVLGTRTGTIGAFAVPAVLLIRHAPRRLRNRKRFLMTAGFGLALLGMLFVLAQEQAHRIGSESYQLRKYSRLAEGELTRVLGLSAASRYTGERSLRANLVGDGSYRYQVGVAEVFPSKEGRALAEVDWMDLYGAHGVVFVAAVYVFYLAFLFAAGAVKHEMSGSQFTIRVMLGAYLLHASLAGHALANPIPTGVIAPVLAYVWVGYRRRQLAYRRAVRTVEPILPLDSQPAGA